MSDSTIKQFQSHSDEYDSPLIYHNRYRLELFIIAGDIRQYRHYIQENNLDPCKCLYVNRLEQLRGLLDIKIIKVGTWWENPIVRSGDLDKLKAYHIISN